MNRRTLVLGTAAAAVTAFVAGALWLRPAPVVPTAEPTAEIAVPEGSALVRPDVPIVEPTAEPTVEIAVPEGSALVRLDVPILGPEDAPVTLVEFFDPACEACRAFHPVVQELRARYPKRVRVVMRYAAFHEGSDEAAGILEAARRQALFEPVLEALYEAQPEWASHGAPQLEAAWQAAAAAGLDIEQARIDVQLPEIQARLAREREDVQTVGVRQTPTFFVNGLPLMEFGRESLIRMVTQQAEAYDA